jgi:crotonobetainyl-CoA:carnitine CoA-transferase CaiB-like acyl-CoA transferase
MTAEADASEVPRDSPRGPLNGVRIVDFTENMSGPLATMILGDQGADVIKVEPPSGDALRAVGTYANGMAAFFANINRSKRSLALNLKADKAPGVVAALVDQADVVLHNFRPVAASKLGIDARSLCSGRPRLIHVTIVGFGTDGPYSGRPAYDHVLQALAGYGDLQRGKNEPPVLVRQGIVDKITAYHVAQAVTAALYERAQTGRGQAIEICMLDVAIAAMWPDGMMNHTILEPEKIRPPVSHSFRVISTKDGFIAFVVVTARQQEHFLQALGLGESKLLTAELLRKATDLIATHSTQDIVDLLARHDVPVAPVLSLDRLHEHEQVRANGSIDEFRHPHLGPIRQANPAVRFADRRASELRPAPSVGEHNHEVLTELGFGQGAIEELVVSGVVASERESDKASSR